jgi:hypothetical protein
MREDKMSRIRFLASSALLAMSVVAVGSPAQAEPKILAPTELEMVTAGLLQLSALQINVNAVTQSAVAVPIAIAVCAACNDPVVTAFADADALNINIAKLVNARR